MSWPKLENGTVDWVSVFNDPETGLIPMINRADTPDKLRACYHIAVQGLFSREADEEIRDKYLYELDKYFSVDLDDRHMTGLQKQIGKLLQEIMRVRVERARTYALQKEWGDERRIPEDDPLELLAAFDREGF